MCCCPLCVLLSFCVLLSLLTPAVASHWPKRQAACITTRLRWPAANPQGSPPIPLALPLYPPRKQKPCSSRLTWSPAARQRRARVSDNHSSLVEGRCGKREASVERGWMRDQSGRSEWAGCGLAVGRSARPPSCHPDLHSSPPNFPLLAPHWAGTGLMQSAKDAAAVSST